MNFSTDRDLLLLEPNVFRDAPFVAQQRVSVNDGVLVGTTLSSITADFASAQVEPGGVVLVNRVAHEVISRDDEDTLTVSLLRTRTTDAAIPSVDVEDAEVRVRTFGPQASLVHDCLLRLLGIDPEDPDGLSEEAVLSLSVMARLEAIGTLERIYSGAAAIAGDNAMLQVKACEYARRFQIAAAQSTVLIDVDGDGHPDERRHLGLIRLTRV